MGLGSKLKAKLNRHTLPVRAPAPASPSSATPLPKSTSSGLVVPDGVAKSLWDEAYDELKEKNHDLVDAYERVVASKIKRSSITSASPNRAEDQTDPPNQIPSTEPDARRDLMMDAVEKALAEVEEQGKVQIGNKQFNTVDAAATTAKAIKAIKDIVAEAVQASPIASLAWAGISMCLPLAINLSEVNKTNVEGIGYVTARIRWYNALEPMLHTRNNALSLYPSTSAEVCRHDLRKIYGQLLEYSMKSVLRIHGNRFKTLLKDAIKWDDWDTTLETLKEAEAIFAESIQYLNQESLLKEFKNIRRQSDVFTEKLYSCFQTLQQISQAQLDALNEANSRLKEGQEISTKQLKVMIDGNDLRQNLAITEEQRKCIQCFFSAVPKYEEYKSAVPKRAEGTCGWVLESDSYLQWLDAGSCSNLLITANPGCGKSVLARHLIDKELPLKAHTVCYFFFKDDNEIQKSPTNALCALLHQLFVQQPLLVKHALPHYRNCGDSLMASLDKLWSILISSASDSEAKKVICVLDALDECAESRREALVQKLDDLAKNSDYQTSSLKFLITSRPYQNIQILFEDIPCIHLGDEQSQSRIAAEIRLVIQEEVDKLARIKKLDTTFRKHLEQALLERQGNDSTYLWIRFTMDSLKKNWKKTTKGLEKVLETLPKDVDDAYTKMLQDSDNPDLMKVILQIVFAARRPLNIREMKAATLVQHTSTLQELLHDEETEEDFKDRIRETCGLFINIVGDRIRFLHQTAKEFILKHDSSLLLIDDISQLSPDIDISLCANTFLARTCIRYLSLEDFIKVVKSDKDLDYLYDVDWGASNHCHERYPFLGYAMRELSSHLESGHPASIQTFEYYTKICDRDYIHLQNWAFIAGMMRQKGMNLISTAAGLGHLILIKHAFEWVGHENPTDSSETSLLRTVSTAYCEDSILKSESCSIDFQDRLGQTALHYASMKGHEEIVRILIDRGAEVDTRDEIGRTALHYALRHGYEEIVRLLIDKGADVNFRDENGRTALHYASRKGHEEIVRLLIDKGADVNFRSNNGWTALTFARAATHKNNNNIERILIDKGCVS